MFDRDYSILFKTKPISIISEYSETGKNDVHPASCEPVCSQITKLPQGTRIKREPKDTVIFDGIEYIYPQAMYVYECEDG